MECSAGLSHIFFMAFTACDEVYCVFALAIVSVLEVVFCSKGGASDYGVSIDVRACRAVGLLLGVLWSEVLHSDCLVWGLCWL